MVDNNYSGQGNKRAAVFAEDDPLAELARIVGFDPQPVKRQPEPASEESATEDQIHDEEQFAGSSEPEEPVINLEDELLRELELYDAPSAPVDEPDEEEYPSVEFEPLEPEPAEPALVEQGPADEQPEPIVAEFESEEPHYAASDAEEDWAPADADVELEDEHFASETFAAPEPEPEPEPESVPASEPDAQDFVAEDAAEDEIAEFHFPEIAAVESAPAEPSEADDEHFDENELTRELYLSIGAFADELDEAEVGTAAEPTVDEQPEEEVPALHEQQEMPYDQPEIRLPVSNFRDGEAAEPVIADEPQEEEAVSQPSAMGFEAEHDRHDDVPPQQEPHWEPDDLLDDISRYPVPFGPTSTPSQLSVTASVSHDFGRALEDEIAMPSIVEDDEELADDGAVVPEIEGEKAVAAPAPSPSQAAASVAIPKFMASSFFRSRQESQAAKEPEAVAPSVAEAVSAPAVDENANAKAETDELPFDPAMISDPDEHPEAIAPLDVPSLPEPAEAEPRPAVSDYEVDVDAEMAAMIRDYPKSAATAAPTAQLASADTISLDDFDDNFEFEDFEKALDEDIHRELQSAAAAGIARERQAAEERLERSAATSPISANRPKRSMLIAASLVLLAGAGAVGAYTWMAGDIGLPELSSEPQIIKADKEAYRTEPANKGGKTVLNQNQAVYDQVSGKSEEQPAQGALISSDEAPVDVVQRTLQPNAIPMEGEPDEATDTASGDERLSPNAADQFEPTDQSGENAGVAPRKVRTLIVRPDGTLVTREEEPAAPLSVTQKNEGAATQPTVTTPAEAAGTTLHPDGNAAEAASQASPEALRQVAESNAAAEANSPDMAPDTPEEAGPPLANAPVPVPRPGNQPVRVVNTETKAAPAVKPAETAAPAPAVQEPAATPAPTVQQATVAPGTYSIQIASLPSEAEAEKSYKNLSAKFASVIGGRGMQIVKADIEGKGTYYRVRIPAGTKDEAVDLCTRYRAAGGSCLVAR